MREQRDLDEIYEEIILIGETSCSMFDEIFFLHKERK